MNFHKWQGLGNDFILVQKSELPVSNIGELSIKLCDRRFGIGADGLITVDSADQADFTMEIYNSDGSKADMCGNGLRCFAAHVAAEGLTQKKEFSVLTGDGLKICTIEKFVEGEPLMVRVNMGKPKWNCAEIPFLDEGEVGPEYVITDSGREFPVVPVNTGVPHAVAFVESFEWDWHSTGKALMTHSRFPEHTNVDFIRVHSPNYLEMKVWERGAGETLACGTGACAALVAAAKTGRSERNVTVSLAGGDLQIEWDDKDDIWMTGPAAKVFVGNI